MKSARASWPATSEPRSSIAFTEISAQAARSGGSIQPSRIPASAACSPSRCTATRSGASPCSAPDPLVAQLGVVVILDDQPVAPLGPFDQRRAALALSTAPVGNWWAGVTTTAAAPTLAQRLTSMPLIVDGDRHDRQPGLLDDQPLAVPAGSSSATSAMPFARSQRHDQREALAKAGADDQCSGSAPRRGRGRGSRRAPRAGRARRAGRRSRPRRAPSGARRCAASAASGRAGSRRGRAGRG